MIKPMKRKHKTSINYSLVAILAGALVVLAIPDLLSAFIQPWAGLAPAYGMAIGMLLAAWSNHL